MTSPLDQLLAELAASRERIAELEAIVTARDASLSLLEATNEQVRQTIQQLSADQALLNRWRFGTRSERVVDDEAQLLLFSTLELSEAANAAEPTVAPDAAPPRRRRTSRGRRPRVFPELLPRERREFRLRPEEIPAELRDNPRARRFLKKIGEMLEVVPMQLKVIEQFQEVIVLDQEDQSATSVQAPTSLTHHAMKFFRQLFDIEDRYRSGDAATRYAARQESSKPLVDKFQE